jgi:hypothetical protein
VIFQQLNGDIRIRQQLDVVMQLARREGVKS